MTGEDTQNVANAMLKQNRSYTITSSPSSAALPLPTPSGNLMNSTTFNMTGSPMNATDSGDSDDDGDDGDDGDYDCGDDGWAPCFNPRIPMLINSGLTT